MKAPKARFAIITRWIVIILLVGFGAPALAQNTKGERPVDNQRQIRETKGKTIKRRDKAKTRDIAGRRLRTKNKSSANSANVGIRQPNPYAKRPRVTTDRAAKPRTRTYSESPSERPRMPKGDISGHRIRTTRPRTSDASGPNIYRQRGPFVNNSSPRPKGDRAPRVHTTTASGQPVVRRIPQQKERAWKGDIKGQPIERPRSISAERINTFPQSYQYQRYVKSKSPRERAISNQREVHQTARSKPPRTSAGRVVYPSSASDSFIKRGKRNVYWGKFSKGERPYTKDLSGAPLRQKNYRSPAAGLVGRDTLQHFGRKPGGDVTFSGKQKEGASIGGSSQRNGWRGDISGHRLRRGKPMARQTAGQKVFPRNLSISRSGRVGSPLPSAPYSTRRRGEFVGQPVQGRVPGIGGKALADAVSRTKGRPTKGFTGQGEGFSGFIKTRGRGIPSGAERVSTYRGALRTGQGKTFENQGEDFSGYIKARRPFKGGGSVSGRLWNNRQTAIDKKGIAADGERVGAFSGNMRSRGKTFDSPGGDFTGYIKARKPLKGGGSVSGLWNNNNNPINQRSLPADADRPGSFSGNIRGRGKTFDSPGGDFTGYIKARKPLKGGGSVSGNLWNNNNTPINQRSLPAGADKPGAFSGNIRGSGKAFESQGVDFTGYTKARKPLKGGGSVSGKLWNNRNEPIDHRVLPVGSDRPGSFAGNLRGGQGKTMKEVGGSFSGYEKARKPLKGGGSISGRPRNNNDEAIALKILPSGAEKPGAYSGNLRSGQGKTMKEVGGNFSGYTKAKKPLKGGGSVSGQLWNNNGEPVTVLDRSGVALETSNFKGKNKASTARPSTAGFESLGKTKFQTSKAGTSGLDGNGKVRMKEDYTQSPNAVAASTKKHTPEKAGFRYEGLQVRVERPNYTEREHSASGALRGVGPSRSTERASRFSSGARVNAQYKHNPNSDDEALKGVYYGGRSTARLGSFQGNVKVKKFGNDRRLHPDAKFAHNPDNNVQEERTILTNVKLFWTKLFHKSESQPNSVRDKTRRPRYDKGEIGMWAE